MRVGLASIYSPRPIPHFINYLSHLLEQAGHQPYFLTCDAAFRCCSNHLFRNLPKWIECGMCMVGGMRSFSHSEITSIAPHPDFILSNSEARTLAYSSAI